MTVDDNSQTWMFPPALSSDFIERENKQLGDGENDSPPDPFKASRGNGTNILYDSVYYLDFAQRLGKEFGKDNIIMSIGAETIPVYSQDVIELMWKGPDKITDSMVVDMHCRQCKAYKGDDLEINEACDKFTDESNITSWNRTLENGQDLTPTYRLTVPTFEGGGASMCMLTLGHSETKLQTQHTVPIFVVNREREEGPYIFTDVNNGGGSAGGPLANEGKEPDYTIEWHDGKKGGLGAGVIAGIAVGAVIGLALLAIGGWFLWRRKRRSAASAAFVADVAGSSSSPSHGGEGGVVAVAVAPPMQQTKTHSFVQTSNPFADPPKAPSVKEKRAFYGEEETAPKDHHYRDLEHDASYRSSLGTSSVPTSASLRTSSESTTPPSYRTKE